MLGPKCLHQAPHQVSNPLHPFQQHPNSTSYSAILRSPLCPLLFLPIFTLKVTVPIRPPPRPFCGKQVPQPKQQPYSQPVSAASPYHYQTAPQPNTAHQHQRSLPGTEHRFPLPVNSPSDTLYLTATDHPRVTPSSAASEYCVQSRANAF